MKVECLSKWEMFQTKVVQEIKTHILSSVTSLPPQKIMPLWDNVEKDGIAWQATDDNIIRRMRFARWITKTTDTRWEYVIFIAFLTATRTPLNITLYVHCLSCLCCWRIAVLTSWHFVHFRGMQNVAFITACQEFACWRKKQQPSDWAMFLYRHVTNWVRLEGWGGKCRYG